MDDHVYVKHKSYLFDAYLEIRQVFCYASTILFYQNIFIFTTKTFQIKPFQVSD